MSSNDPRGGNPATDGAGMTGGQEVLVTINLWSTHSEGHHQPQLRICGRSKSLREVGVYPKSISARHGKYIVYTIQLADGGTRELVQGDTHAVWLQHQRGDENTRFFMKLLEAAKLATVELKVIGIKHIDITTEAPPSGPFIRF